jgi:corrinoid protein of di/trimethylamine methyltransferase
MRHFMSNHIEKLYEAVLNYDIEKAEQIATEAVNAGVNPLEAIENGITAGIREVGDRFHRFEVFLPHLVLAGDAATAAMNVLIKAIPKDKLSAVQRGRIIVGTVEGDLHDLGKNIVVMMLKAASFEVFDLGKDVKTDIIIERAQELKADVIGVSSLMTTTRPYQRELVEELERLGLRDQFKVIVGGGPVTQEWADNIGADGYGRDALEAVTEANRLLGIKD